MGLVLLLSQIKKPENLAKETPSGPLSNEEVLKRLGYFDWPTRQPSNLQKPLPTVFERKSFRGTNDEYAMIQPAIRLASALLSTTKSMLFIYSLVYECRKLPKQFDFNGNSCFQFCRTLEKDPKVLLPRLDRILRQFSSYHTWGPAHASWDSHLERGQMKAKGFTIPEYYIYPDRLSEEGPALKYTDSRCGYPNIVFFNRQFLVQIRRLREQNKTNSVEMLNLQFDLARILCHELVHAINLACSSQARLMNINSAKVGESDRKYRQHEPYYEDQELSELGVAWEVEMFGGYIGVLSTNSNTWPCGITTVARDQRRFYPGKPWKGHKPPVDERLPKRAIVSVHYVHQIQQQSFWDKYQRPIEKESDRDADDLIIPWDFAAVIPEVDNPLVFGMDSLQKGTVPSLSENLT